jgi:glutathione S-transferase
MDHANGRHLYQSAAILEYLSDVTGRFGGATLEERIRAREWMDWDFIRLRGPDPLLPRLQAQPSQHWPRRRQMDAAEARTALQVLEHHLVGGT